MKKKVFGYLALGFVTLSGMVATAISTFSWFVASVVTPEYKLSGSSAGAYFAYGDGSANHPFGISIPRHLYNLSWLQYMGQFSDKQYYFELADSVPDTGLDMNNYYLPPIGTKDEPFVSNFNGNGKIIKNLTVTNDESTIFGSTKHPDRTSVDYEAPEIVGLFGVVGNYNDSLAEANYDTQANTIFDLGLSNITVQTTTNKALVGIAAGYVDAPISNVAVNESTVDVNTTNTGAVDGENLTTNLSDYGTIGYATSSYKKSIKKIDHELYDVEIGPNAEFNATDSGDALGWGGSIDMNSIFTRLNTLRTKTNNNFTTSSHPFVQTVTHYDDDAYGEPTVTTSSNQNVYRFPEDNPNYTNFGNNTYNYCGSINYSHSESTKHYLVGGTYQTHRYYTYYQHTGVKINDGNGHFLTVTNIANNTNVTQNTTEANAIVWVIESGNTPRIYTEYNATPYYLIYYNDTTMRLSTTANTATRWNKETNASGGVRYTYNNRMIAFNNNAWSLVAAPQMPTQPTAPVDPYAEPIFDYDPLEEPTAPAEVENPGARPTAPKAPTSMGYQLFNTSSNYFLIATNNTTFTRNANPFNGGWEWTGNLTNGSTGNIRLKNAPTYLLRHPTGNSQTLTLSNTANNNNSPDWTLAVVDGGYKFYYYEGGNQNRIRYLQSNNNSPYFRASARNTDQNDVFTYIEYATYKDNTMTMANATTAYNNDLAALAGQQSAWDTANAEYQAYLQEYAAWQTAHAAWQSAHDDWQADHDQWVADETYRNTTYPALVTQYNNDLNTYNNSFYINTIAITNENPVIGPDSHQTDADIAKGHTRMYYTYEDTSYFPINADANYQAKLENTGYFVAGSTDTTWSDGNNSPRSLIFSSYSKTSKIKGYDNTNKVIPDSAVYTVDFNQSNQLSIHAINLNDSDAAVKYSKYADSKAGLEKVLKDTSNVGGFHFYAKNGNQGFVSKDAVVEARDVRMKGESYRSYELPVNALDFYLKEKGRVNFFAGMYNGGTNYGTSSSGHMNGFFSLFRVLRDNNEHITDIKEVQAIYGNESHKNWSYIYEYKDGKFSKPYRIGVNSKYELTADNTGTTPYVESHELANINTYTSATYGYKKLFDNDWLGYYYYGGTSDYQGRVFYFEIPTDEGEYCLGRYQTDGTAMDGAYLMYLDIGANAAKTQRTTVYEHYKEIRKVFDYPIGIAIVPVSAVESNITNGTNLDETNTANFLITAGTNGTIKVKRVDNDVEVTRTNGLLTSAKPTLVGDLMWDDSHQQYNIHDPGGTDNLSDEITSEDTFTEVRRLQYYDWNVNMSELMITQIIDTTTDSGTTWTRSYYQEYADGSSTTTFSQMKIYNTNGGVKYLTEADLASVNTYLIRDGSPAINNTLILKISYQEDNGEEVTYEWVLHLDINGATSGTGQYYTIGSGTGEYVFEASVNNGSVTLKVVSINAGGKTLKINGTTITTANQTVTLTPAPANP